MLKAKRKREQEEGKATEFYLHDELVPAAKIIRYRDRMIQQGKLTHEDTLSQIGKQRHWGSLWNHSDVTNYQVLLGSYPGGLHHPQQSSQQRRHMRVQI
jgi:hypothetical protein